jgi:hypothetical protein
VEDRSVAYYGKYEPFDLGGRVLLYDPGWLFNRSSAQEPPDADASIGAHRTWNNWNRVAEKYNTTIQQGWSLGYWDVPDAIIEGFMSGVPVADMVVMITFHPLQTASAGVLHRLTEIAPPQSDIWGEQLCIIPSSDPYVKDFGFYMSPLVRGREGQGIGYNRDILASLGLEDPKALWRAGRWNVETFFDYANQATRMNSAGVVEQWGMAFGWLQLNKIMMNAYQTWEYTYDPVTQRFSPGYTDPNFVLALEQTVRAYQDDKVNPYEDGNYYAIEPNNYYLDGNVLFWNMQVNRVPIGDDALTFDYGIVPWPLIPGNNSGIHFLNQDIVCAIPIGVANPMVVFQIFEELMGTEVDILDELWENQYENISRYFRHLDDVEVAMEINHQLQRTQIIMRHDYNWENLVFSTGNGSETVAQAIEARLPEAQAKIDELLHRDHMN